MPARKGLLAPQNTFLDTIATRFDGTHANFVIGNAKIARVYPIVYCSDGFCELTGYTRAQVMQKSCACNFLYGAKTDVQHKSAISTALDQKQEVKLELILYKSSGMPFWCLLDICGIQNESHEVVLILCAYKDITKEKFHAQQRQLLAVKGAQQQAAAAHSEQQQLLHHHHPSHQAASDEQQVGADKNVPDTSAAATEDQPWTGANSSVAASTRVDVHPNSNQRQATTSLTAANEKIPLDQVAGERTEHNGAEQSADQLAGNALLAPPDDKALISMDEFGLEEGDESEEDTDKHTASQYSRRRSRAVLYQLSGHYGGNPRGGVGMKSKLKLNNRINIPEYKTTTIAKKKFILSHYGLVKSCWDWLILIVTFYVAIVVPYNAAFKQGEQQLQAKQQQETGEGCKMDVDDIVVEVVFIIDVILNFRTTFVNRKGEVVTKPKIICSHYIRGWFVVDACAALPFDLLCSLNLNGRSPIDLNLLKLIRLLRLARLLQKMDRYSQYSYIILTLLMLIFSLLAHWCACIWYVIAKAEVEKHRGDANWHISWLHHLKDKLGYDVTNGQDIASTYVTALYFTTSSLTSVGFGNVSATTNAEKIFSIVIMLIGALMHAVVFGNVTALIRVMYARRSNYQTRLRDLKDFFRLHQLPKELQQRMSDYFQTTWSLNHGIEITEILRDFPEELRGDVSLHLHREVLALPIFNTAPQGFLKSLARHIESKFCCPTEYLIHRGDALNYLYLVCNGSMEVLQDNMVVGILGKGDLVGYDVNAVISPEHTQFGGLNKVNSLVAAGLVKSSSDLKALTYCDLKCINISGLLEVLKLYPEFSDTFHDEIVHDLSFNLRETHEEHEGDEDVAHHVGHDDEDDHDEDDEDSDNKPPSIYRGSRKGSPPPQAITDAPDNNMGRLCRSIEANRTIGRYDHDENGSAAEDDHANGGNADDDEDDDLDQVEEVDEEEEEETGEEDEQMIPLHDRKNDDDDDNQANGAGSGPSNVSEEQGDVPRATSHRPTGQLSNSTAGGHNVAPPTGGSRGGTDVRSLSDWQPHLMQSASEDERVQSLALGMSTEALRGRRANAGLQLYQAQSEAWQFSNSYEGLGRTGCEGAPSMAHQTMATGTTRASGSSSSGHLIMKNHHSEETILDQHSQSIKATATQLRTSHESISAPRTTYNATKPLKPAIGNRNSSTTPGNGNGDGNGGGNGGGQISKKPPLAFDLSRNTTALVDRRRRSAGCIPKTLLSSNLLTPAKSQSSAGTSNNNGSQGRRALRLRHNTHSSLTHINEDCGFPSTTSSSGTESKQRARKLATKANSSNGVVSVGDRSARQQGSQLELRAIDEHLSSVSASVRELRQDMDEFKLAIRTLVQVVGPDNRQPANNSSTTVYHRRATRQPPPEGCPLSVSLRRRKCAEKLAQSTSNISSTSAASSPATTAGGGGSSTFSSEEEPIMRAAGRKQRDGINCRKTVAFARSQSACVFPQAATNKQLATNFAGDTAIGLQRQCYQATNTATQLSGTTTNGAHKIQVMSPNPAAPPPPIPMRPEHAVKTSPISLVQPDSSCDSPLTPVPIVGLSSNDSGRSSSSVGSSYKSESGANPWWAANVHPSGFAVGRQSNYPVTGGSSAGRFTRLIVGERDGTQHHTVDMEEHDQESV